MSTISEYVEQVVWFHCKGEACGSENFSRMVRSMLEEVNAWLSENAGYPVQGRFVMPDGRGYPQIMIFYEMPREDLEAAEEGLEEG